MILQPSLTALPRFTGLLLGLLLLSCSSKEEYLQPVVQDITESVYASGKVKTENQYEAFASVNGIIRDLLVKEGDTVRKGQPIIALVDESARLSAQNARIVADYSSVGANREKLEEARASIELARVKLQTDSISYVRQKNLWANSIGSRNELDQRALAYENARTSYETARLRYQQLDQQLRLSARQSETSYRISSTLAGDFLIRARQDGRVYQFTREPGEAVTIQTPLALLGDAHRFLLALDVDEYDVSKIAIGQKLFVRMDSYKGQVFEAFVSKIDPVMNERSRSMQIEARFAQAPPSLYPNLTAEANILIRSKSGALTIPRSCLLEGGYVFLKNGEKRKVRTGLIDYQYVEILEGLSAGESIKRPAQ